MTNEELVNLIQQGKDIKTNLEILYEQNKRFIYKTAYPFMKYTDADDLLQEAYIGFQEAVFAYNADGGKLTTYATWRIRRYCIDYIEKFCHAKKPIICISIDTPLPGTDDITVKDTIPDDYNMEETVHDVLFQEHERDILNEAIFTLKPNEKIVVSSRYWEGLSQKQVAERLSLSAARIGQIEKEALRKLRQLDSIQELILERYGYNSIKNYQLSRGFCLNKHTSSTEQTAIKRIMLEEKKKEIQKNLDELFDELLS